MIDESSDAEEGQFIIPGFPAREKPIPYPFVEIITKIAALASEVLQLHLWHPGN
jgi:hypothetical protein